MTPAAADDAMIIEVRRLSLDTATTLARAALDACRAKGIQVGVTVVDRDGTVQVALRDTIAAPITLPVSKGKAVAAVNFNVSTADLAIRANTPLGRLPGMMMLPGGLPVQVGGSLLGGVGVSGSPSGDTDAECAQAGLNAVMDDLEMEG
ncbi:MAG: heme-binding protein [Pseudomonadota bacterium]